MSVRVAAAAEVSHAERAARWTESFSDYFTPGAFTADSLAAFERAFDLNREASRVLFEGDRPVAFAMLGVRAGAGAEPAGESAGREAGPGGALPRGWVGGMGVIPSARRRGHGERVMVELIGAAREIGIRNLRLEVLVQNTPAIPLYERLGFRTLRKLEVWDRPGPVAARVGRGPAHLCRPGRTHGRGRRAAGGTDPSHYT